MHGSRWISSLTVRSVAALALIGCGELLGIDPIEYRPPSDGGGTSGGSGGIGGSGGAGGDGGVPLPETVTGRGCTSSDLCGDAGVSCCESRLIRGTSLGPYPMGCSFVPGRPCNTETEGPEHPGTVGDFYLDTFEVTVGRFRQFAEEYNAWRNAGHPSEGEGQHPRIPDSGWRSAWGDDGLPLSDAHFNVDLGCKSGFYSWKIDADPRLAQNCLTWPLAFAFCVWSGGRLPTEAEWEIAAAGADENRLYAWGIDAPTPDLAVYNHVDEIPPESFWLGNVGSKPAGVGRFGHLDLSGNIGEWTLDRYSVTWFQKGGGGNPCIDCANVGDAADDHVLRGGSWAWDGYELLTAGRDDEPPVASERFGVRCARDGPP
jgi:formylglycine-generating enzyme required for sulfatase activity